MKNILIVLLFLSLGCKSNATKYYVSQSEGDDAITQSSDQTPWKTIAKVNAQTFQPGDEILFKKGDIWRETLIIPSSGTKNNHIVFGAYGEGNHPRIYGSEQATGWTNVSGNIWVSGNVLEDPTDGAPHHGQEKGINGKWPGGTWFVQVDGSITWGHEEKYMPLTNLTEEYDWVWDSDHIYVYSPTNPGSQYSAVESAKPSIEVAIKLNNAEYITIDGLEMRFTCSGGMEESYPPIELHGLIVRNCRSSYHGIHDGANAMGISTIHSESHIHDNIVHDCGRRGITVALFGGPDIRNITIENNIVYNNFHDGISMIQQSSGSFKNFIIRNNIIWQDTTENLVKPESFPMNQYFLSNRSTGSIDSIFLIGNIFMFNSMRCIHVEDALNLFIYNNTFYRFNPVSSFTMIALEDGTQNVRVANNIFYSNQPNRRFMRWKSGTGILELDYNIYDHVNPEGGLVEVGGTDPLERYGLHQWDNYKSQTGFDSHSPTPPYSAPVFVSNNPINLDLHPNSPARGIGLVIPGITSDPANIGADASSVPSSTEPKSISQQNLFIFPNPAKDFINIEIGGIPFNNPISIRIFDLSGKIVYENSVEFSSNIVRIPFKLSSGIYPMQVSSGTTARSILIVIE